MNAYQPNMTGWVRALADKGITLPLGPLADDRLAEIESLIACGLPTYAYHIHSLTDFIADTHAMEALFARYDEKVVVRAVPIGGKGQRFTRIAAPYEACRAAFADLGKPYVVIVNEYDPASFCGIAISSPDRLLIEMVGEPNLENLAHGAVIPWHGAFAPRVPGAKPLLRPTCDVPGGVRTRMWRVVHALSHKIDDDGALPHYVSRTGYFEFVFSARDDALRFIDYKDTWR